MPDDKTYVDKVVRIAELAAGEPGYRLNGFTWRRCRMEGPAVILPIDCTMDFCSYGGPADVVLWEILPHRPGVIGAIFVTDCTFDHCTFYGVGFAGVAKFIEDMKESAKRTSGQSSDPTDSDS